jgi:predicted transcriptional regulator
MSIAEIKERIHEQIENLSDTDMLLVIDDLLSQNYKPSEDIRLSTEQKIALQKSEADFTAGRVLTREKAASQVSDWLKRNP